MTTSKVNESFNQLPLNFKNDSHKTFKEFVIGKNKELIESLNSFIGSNEILFYLWGDSGTGKSHILQSLVSQLNENNRLGVVVTPIDISNRQNVNLIQMFDIICIDNVENIAENPELEEALFFWINEIKQANKKIILSSQISNQSNFWQLPDLKSRILSGRTSEVKALDRDQTLEVFKKLADQKAIVIDFKIEKYLQNNCPMNLKFLSKLLNQLDEVTLIQKKHVTIPLLKNILQTVLVK
jgi:DnaA family protein